MFLLVLWLYLEVVDHILKVCKRQKCFQVIGLLKLLFIAFSCVFLFTTTRILQSFKTEFYTFELFNIYKKYVLSFLKVIKLNKQLPIILLKWIACYLNEKYLGFSRTFCHLQKLINLKHFQNESPCVITNVNHFLALSEKKFFFLSFSNKIVFGNFTKFDFGKSRNVFR